VLGPGRGTPADPAEERLRRFLSTVQVNWSDANSVEHGASLANEIHAAHLLPLDGAGHGLDPADSERITHAILNHASIAPPIR